MITQLIEQNMQPACKVTHSNFVSELELHRAIFMLVKRENRLRNLVIEKYSQSYQLETIIY